MKYGDCEIAQMISSLCGANCADCAVNYPRRAARWLAMRRRMCRRVISFRVIRGSSRALILRRARLNRSRGPSARGTRKVTLTVKHQKNKKKKKPNKQKEEMRTLV